MRARRWRIGMAGAMVASGIGTLLAMAQPVGAATSAGTQYSITGSAQFSSGLNVAVAPGSYSYSFTGDLASVAPGGPTGTITATGAATGGCLGGYGGGQAVVAWNDGQTSDVAYLTQSVGAVVVVTGQVNSGEYVGSALTGALAFQVSSPQDCVGSGVTAANFTGGANVGASAQ